MEMSETIIGPQMGSQPKLNGICGESDTYERHNGEYFDYCESASAPCTNGNLSEPNGECSLIEKRKQTDEAIELQQIKLTDKKDEASSSSSFNRPGPGFTCTPTIQSLPTQPETQNGESEQLRKIKLRKERREQAKIRGWTQSTEIPGHAHFKDLSEQLNFVGITEKEKRAGKKSHGKVKKTKSGSLGRKSLSDGEGKPSEVTETLRRERSASPQMEKSPKQNGANPKPFKSNGVVPASNPEPPTFELPFDEDDFQPVGARRKKLIKESRGSEPPPRKQSESLPKPLDSHSKSTEQRRATSLEPNNNSIRRPDETPAKSGECSQPSTTLPQSAFPVLGGRRRSWGDVRIAADQPATSSSSLTDDESVKSQPVMTTAGEMNSWARVAQGYKPAPLVNESRHITTEPRLAIPQQVKTVESSKRMVVEYTIPERAEATKPAHTDATKYGANAVPKNYPNQTHGNINHPPNSAHSKPATLKSHSDQSALKATSPVLGSKLEVSSQTDSAIKTNEPEKIASKPNVMSTSLNIDFLSMHKSLDSDEDRIIIDLLTKNINAIIQPFVPKVSPHYRRKASSLPPASSNSSSSRGVEFVDCITHSSSTVSSITFGFPEPIVFGFDIATKSERPLKAKGTLDEESMSRHRQLVAGLEKQWKVVLDERKRQGSRKRVVWLDEFNSTP